MIKISELLHRYKINMNKIQVKLTYKNNSSQEKGGLGNLIGQQRKQWLSGGKQCGNKKLADNLV